MTHLHPLLKRLKEFLECSPGCDPAEFRRKQKIARMSLDELEIRLGSKNETGKPRSRK